MDYTQPKKPQSYLERYVATKGIGSALSTAGDVLSKVGGAMAAASSEEDGMEASLEQDKVKNPELYSGAAKPPVQGSVNESTARLRDLTGLSGTKGLY